MDGGGDDTYGSTVPFCGALHVPDIPEHLTRQAVARRVMAACQNIRILPDREERFLRGPSKNPLWQQVVREWTEYAADDVKLQPPRPSPKEVTDCMVALGWCAKLDDRDFRLIWSYSFPKINFSLIAGRYGRSDETIRIWYWRAIDKVWEIALKEAGFVANKSQFCNIGEN